MVPKAGEWYAVTTRPFLFAFGMGNLVEYRVKDFAKQTFFLGFLARRHARWYTCEDFSAGCEARFV